MNEIGINTHSVHDILRDYYLSDVSRKKILRRYHARAAEYYLSIDDDPEHVLEAAYHFDEAEIKEKSAAVIINHAKDFISKGFWKKIEDQLLNAINSLHRKTQPQIIQLIARANLEIGTLYDEKGEYDIGLHHATQSLMLFKKINDFSSMFNSYTLLFSIYYHKNENDKAKEYIEKCLKIAEKRKDDVLKAVAMSNFGNLISNDDPNNSLNYYINSLKIFENKNDEIKIATSCYNIADAYAWIENYEKSYEYIKRALELVKKRNAVYKIAQTKILMANIYYYDPKKSVSDDSIIKCLKEALETYEKIGHVRGTAEVLMGISHIYHQESDFKSEIAVLQKAAILYFSLNQQSQENEINSKMGFCFTKLKDFHNAKLYFEKNLLSDHCIIEDKLSLAEVYLNIGDYNEAFNLSSKIIASGGEEISDDKRRLANLFLSISSVLLNKVDDAYRYLKKTVEVGNQKFNLNWDFSDIEPILDKTEKSKQIFIDTIALLKGNTNYPIIRFEDIKIVSEEIGIKADVFHPFTGLLTITKDDENLKKIMKNLSLGAEIDLDTLEIMEIKRDEALLTLGFLFKKGFLDCKILDKQNFELKLTNRGLKILRLSEVS